MDSIDLVNSVDSVDLIGLVFDHQYFADSIRANDSTDWLSRFEHYKSICVSQCLPPNKEFAAQEELLYRGERECNLDKWLKTINETSKNELNKFRSYINFQDDYTSDRQKLFRENLNKVADHFPKDLEKLLVIDNSDIKTWVLKALDKKATYELNEETIESLEDKILEKNTGKKFLESATNVLTNHVTHYDKDHKHLDFLIDLIKQDKIDAHIQETIFKKFSEDANGVKNWGNKQFDRFALALDDCSSNSLVKGLFSAQKQHGYIPDIDKVPFFEKCLDNPVMRGAAGGFIAKSLEKCLLTELSTKSPSELGKIEDHAINLLNKTGSLEPGLENAIFEAYNKLELYKKNQSHFNGLIVDLVASDKLLPTTLLKKLAEPLTKIEDPKVALFIATRLAQHYVDLPSETLSHFVQYLNDKDEHVSILAVNLYYLKRANIPGEITEELVDGLIALLPKSSELQHAKINDILNRNGFIKDQSLRHEIQERIFNWHKAESLEVKITISRELSNKISDKTAKELTPFFKEHLVSQNAQLIEIASSAFKELRKYKDIVWNKEENDLLALIEAEQTREIFFEFEINNGVKFLLSAEEWDSLEEQLGDFSWDIEEYVKQIDFTDIRELKKLLDFIKSNEVSKKEFHDALGNRSDIPSLYSKLLKELIAGIGDEIQANLSLSDKKALKTSAELLVDKLEWPADFLFSLIKKTEERSLVELISVLEKIAKYSVSLQAIDREGVTAYEILKDFSIEKLLGSISRVINDNHFYMSKNIGTLIEEVDQLNSDNPRLQSLIDSKYFSEQLLKIAYEIEITENEPSDCELSRLYLYKTDDKIYIKTTWGAAQVVNFEPAELERLSHAIEDKDLSREQTEDLIYKKAAELGIGLESIEIKPILRGSSKPLEKWDDDDFLVWRKTITKVNDDNIAEVVAVISQAAYNTYLNKSYPRPIQLISILSLFKSPGGGLAQIATGEGKSLIIAIFAMINVFDGRQVDILTSSSVLAMRDVDELKGFYGQLGINVAHNIDGSNGVSRKKCYTADVIYGDTRHFIGDDLRDLSNDVKQGRGFDLVIIDEVDNVLMDQISMKVQLANTIPRSEALIPIYIYMHGTALAIASNLKAEGEKCYLKMPHLTDEQKATIEHLDLEELKTESYESQLLNGTCAHFIKDQLTHFVKDKLFAFEQNRPGRLFIVPSHLEGFVKDQLQKWINSLEMSFYLQEKVHYINIINPEPNATYPFKIVAPIDYENTGVIQYGLQWSDGQHQFIQAKHGLTMFPENVLSVFMSYAGFFNKYKGSIYGVTGTLGEKPHHEFLKNVYGVELSVIPTFIEKDLSKFPPIIVDTMEQWYQEIRDVVKRTIGSSRAGLIVVETIEEVESLKAFLENSGHDKAKIFVYGTGSDKAKEYDVANKRELEPGEIIIATNMAGRGTDLKISAKVKKHGGLHVMVAVFPESIRVQDQNFGRSARQGEPGSAQIIVSLEQIEQTVCSTQDIGCLIKERNEREIEKLEEYRLCKLPSFEILDKLFDSFVELANEINSPTGYKLIVGRPAQSELEPKSIYLYQEAGRIWLKIVQENTSENIKDPIKDLEPLDITELLSRIDPRAANHIKTILSDNRPSSLTLNNQDSEIIHFIVTRKGYTDYPEIDKRVNYKFNEELTIAGLEKNAYLLRLLSNNPDFADLKNDVNALEKAEIRKQYELWIADRNLFNNKYEIQQITEYWGVWLKKYSALVEERKNCNIGSEEEIKESFRLLFEDLKAKFDEFKASIGKKKEDGKLFENPNYLVQKAWQYLWISLQGNEPQRIDTQKSEEGWYNYAKRIIKDTIHSVLGKRINIGRENINPINPRESAMGFCKNATNLDDIYAWTAYNAMAVIGTIKDGEGITEENQAKEAAEVKQRFCENENNATRRILESTIPAIDAEIAFLLIGKTANYEDDHLIQLIGKKEIYLKMVSRMQDAIDKVVKSTGKEGIRIGRFIPYDEITKDINITSAFLKAVNKTGDVALAARLAMNNLAKGSDFASKQFTVDQILLSGGYIHELFTFELEEQKRDWVGTILAVVVAVASIYTGLWLINVYGASSIFLATIGSGLLTQGIGDIVQAAIAVGTGNPIDAESYITSKGIATAATILTAGFLQIASTFPAIQGLGVLQAGADKMVHLAQSPVNLIATIGASQMATRVIGMGLQSAGKNLVDEESIKAEAQRSIDELISSHKEELNIIHATDEFNGGSKVLQSTLNHGIEVAVYKHQGKFHSDQAMFVTNVASHVGSAFAQPFGFGNILNAGMQFAMGAVKNAEAMSKVYAATEKVIESTAKKALSTGAMMERLLNKNLENGVGIEVFKEAKEKGLIKNGEIEYRKCDEFTLAGKFSKFNDALVENCKSIAKLLLKERDFKELKDNFVNWVSGLKISIQNKDMVGAFTNLAAVEAGQFVGTKLVNLADKKIEEGKQARAAQGGTGKGRGTGAKSKYGYEREKVNAEEIAQNTGLNQGPERGKDAFGQGKPKDSAEGNKGTGGQGNNQARGETPGWKPVEEPKVLIATDGTEHAEGGIRTDVWGMGLPEGQNVRYISGTTSAEFEGRTYAISYKGVEILSADGSTVLSRESTGQAIEVKNGIGVAGIGIGQIQDGVLIDKMETEAIFDRFSFYEKNDYVNNIHNQIFNQWNSQEGNLLGLSEAFPNEGFGFDIKFSEGSRGFVRDGVKILSDNSNEQLLPEPKSQYYAGGGPIGSGLLSMEDAKLMKEFLGSEEFKVYLSDVREGFVAGFVDMGKDAIELSKVAIKYGCHPSGVTIFQIALAVHKLRVANAGKELEVIGQGVWNVAKGVWTEIKESTTTGKGHGHILAEATSGVVVGRALKVFKIAGKVVDEVMDAVPDAKVCPREFGLGEKLDFKPHSPVDADDLGGKLDGFISPKNREFYTRYKVDTKLYWAHEYNEWVKIVDPKNINLHHVLSNKGKAIDAIQNHPIFKDGLLDFKMLKVDENIMVLPKKTGMHPTMNVHAGGRHTNLYKADMNDELTKILEDFDNRVITKDQIVPKFWEAVDKEKTRLFNGESKIYNKNRD